MRLIIAGGRAYRFTPQDIAYLDGIRERFGPIEEVIHGASSGADREADRWARTRGIPVRAFPAYWMDLGPKAGPIRNHAMAKHASQSGPCLCILFPGGKGTQSMRKEAERAKIQTLIVH